MRGIYKAFLFMLIFQMCALTLSVLGVFGSYGLYSDIDFESFPNDFWGQIQYFFGASYGEYSSALSTLGIAIAAIIIGAGAIGAVRNGNITPLMMGVLGAMSLHMIITSKQFFGTIFEKGGIGVIYLGLCLFVAVAALILFALIEYPVGGDSG